MTRFTNINTLVCLAAVIIIFTPIPAAPVQDDIAIMGNARAMQILATGTARERHHAKGFTIPTHIRTHQDLACFVSASTPNLGKCGVSVAKGGIPIYRATLYFLIG
ncbi:hypothetical protein SeLEV6574_g07988 [Synchytrium endobioticum]|uniref:Uncharacterized protein n=1 Tax=Synchytrium endobioticum TaxID=286115 RepID=A0A507CH16_9FUNG|nr:hypothetical protein SeLEV6574_g07988 [Synchytrium endobioticum]